MVRKAPKSPTRPRRPSRAELNGPPTALTRSQIRRLLDDHGLIPSRALGQNFLCDSGTVDKIVRLAEVTPDDHVLEIGPGLGSLTLGLCATGARVVTVEVDRYLVPALRSVVGHYEESGALTIINDDIRRLDLDPVLGRDRWVVVANLPYNIATPLVLDLLADRPSLQRWVVMVQREAGERLVAEAGSKRYGIPSVLLAYWATARLVGWVAPELFLPRPNVDSVLVRIDRRPEPRPPELTADFERLAALVRAGFGQRRKMLRRSLEGLVRAGAFTEAGVPATARPEELSIEDWVRLATVAP